MEENKERIEGTVEEIIYANEANGYTVCVIDADGEPVTLVGIIPYLTAGERIKAIGAWKIHHSFGRQFQAEAFEKSLPEDDESVWRYLSSGAIRGIGPVTARRIIDRFGSDTLKVLETNPEWLSDIRGITTARAAQIGESYAAQFGARETMIFLGQYFGTALSVKIYKKYRTAAPDIVKSNPYRLCGEIQGIGFDRADAAARELGFAPDCPERIEAGLNHTLMAAAYQNGHCYLPSDMLVTSCAESLGIEWESVADILALCIHKGTIVKRPYDGHDGCAVTSIYGAELYVSEKLLALSRNTMPFPLEKLDEQIAVSAKKQGIEYDPMQTEAIVNAVSRGVSIVTGGPGTGKTTVIKAIIDIFEALDIKYSLAAPTGRAAKRMSEASGRDAKTIHRLLEMVYSEDGSDVFSRNEDNPLPAKAIIIDETSMVDVFLMNALLRAVKPDAMMIFIGDSDQLPPVGPGNTLNDMIESGLFRVTRLCHIFRQAEQSLIIVNAHRINDGREPELKRKDADFFFLERHDPKELISLVCSLCRDRLPAAYGFSPYDDIQVISPTRRGVCGTRELNIALQEALNPPNPRKKEKRMHNAVFRQGDKIMQIKNNYDLVWTKDGEEGMGIFNGDIGRITDIDFRDEHFTINFDGRICEYDFVISEELELAYAVTVHKAQGSEYPAVILPVLQCPRPLKTRNLLYTAVTRAKRLLVAVGSTGTVSDMVENERRDVRFTSLPTLFAETQNTRNSV